MQYYSPRKQDRRINQVLAFVLASALTVGFTLWGVVVATA